MGTLAHSFLLSIFGEDSSQYKLFVKNCEDRRSLRDSIPKRIKRGLAVLNAAKTDIERGYLKKIEALVSADIFSDFLEMASYLLSEGYKDPAAVMIGSTLEEHLRKLCNKNSIDIEYTNGRGDLVPKKADAMNADLVKANIYNKLDQKSVTTWLDLRNKAAHGQYGEYTKEQVELMLQGVTNFMTRIPL
ncbi:DUF4145 domain-containing protein [Cylindrospermum stagnale]|uniref:DUF4145 domain-containing protein n=1 Tax=Cylindrospermum stagnale TaxID=142864 RepID=UPI0002F08408|nr:DUF4145 domain-containing protein [Cylindrospermum stagnale]